VYSRPAYPCGNCGEMLAESVTQDDILQAFPELEHADIREALQGRTDNHVV
jgi:uncharacterized protein (DUF433 family)